MAKWCLSHHKEAWLLHTTVKDICEIMRAYDVSFSSVMVCVPRIADANDEAHSRSLKHWASLQKSRGYMDCQVMIEGPGHVPMHLIKENMKAACRFAMKPCH